MKALKDYKAKRNFKVTPEPAPRAIKAKKKNLSFVVQEHHASHLHYDFRLEVDGVLKSWAVPKGPSMDPKDKRLAVEVEDHPLEYGSFEGTIPEKQYGAGQVFKWDFGVWEPVGSPQEGLKKGRLEFRLYGLKLSGLFILVRTRSESSRQRQWFLIKRRDEKAVTGWTLESVRAKTVSKTKTSALRVTPRATRSQSIGAKPEFMSPQLARLVERPPDDDGWVHEVKFDGYRIQAHFERGKLQLFTRNGHDWTEKYPTVAKELKTLCVKKGITNCVLDGELVSLDSEGRSQFQALQNLDKTKAHESLVYFVFDLLFVDGEPYSDYPLSERKQKLESIIDSSQCVRLSPSFYVKGRDFFKACCADGLEGMISKRQDAPYSQGRSLDWVKSKCQLRQEFVIGGYTDPQGSREGLGALLLGIHEGETLRYVGRVGTGFTTATLKDLLKELKKLQQSRVPFQKDAPTGKGLHWVRPKLLCEVSFANWTEDGHLRAPVFQGLRKDKPASEIQRDEAMTTLTHPDKVIYKRENITKRQVADYYQNVAPLFLKHSAGRPLSLLRCPSGSESACFFQKHFADSRPPSVHLVAVREKSGSAEYAYVDKPKGLLELVQLGTLEFHTWNSSVPKVENPDQFVMDFDPSPETGWDDVLRGVETLKSILDQLKLKSFVKVTGGKGVHVHIPLTPLYTYDQIKDFSRALAVEMASREPKLYTAALAKKSRTGKIFIDYLRNGYGATAVAPYSLRARSQSAVAMPVEWEELYNLPGADHFTLKRAQEHLKTRARDPWIALKRTKQKVSILDL